MDRFRYVRQHADTLASGRPVGYGDTFELSAEDQKDPHNSRLIDEGAALKLPAKTAARSGKDGGS